MTAESPPVSKPREVQRSRAASVGWSPNSKEWFLLPLEGTAPVWALVNPKDY